MVFNDLFFLYYIIPLLIIYYGLNRVGCKSFKNVFLLFASLIFYGLFNCKMLFVLLFVIIVNYLSIRILLTNITRNKYKSILAIDVVLSLLPLFIFKYFDFFLNRILCLEIYCVELLIVPVGISFFTFQALSYTIDVYRGKEKNIPSFMDFALYVAFFPCILSGPIERARTLMPQIRSLQMWNIDHFLNGLQIFIYGLFQKIVVADSIANYVNAVYVHPTFYSGNTLLLAIGLYSIQIYCDFAGYSNMAIGVGRMLGFDIRKNFNFPYFSTTIRSFWRKWHMSLTSWFTEYVYISLGGNRVKESRWIANILIVFLVSGLWHGAAWTFVIWGVIHGVFQILEYYVIGKKEFTTWWGKCLAGLFLFAVVSIAWVFFRSPSFEIAWQMICGACCNYGKLYTWASFLMFLIMLFLTFLLIICEVLLYKRKLTILEYNDNPFKWRNLIFTAVMIWFVCFLGTSGAQFVYFQF